MNATKNDKKSITQYARILHRNVGYFVLGLTLVYALSGIVLIYRNTDFLKTETYVEMSLPAQLPVQALSKRLHLRRMEVTHTEGDVVYFQGGQAVRDGTYNSATGAVSYTGKTLPAFVERLTRLHKVNSSKTAHWFAVGYGLMLLFLALSSFFMFKPGTAPFRRGLIISGAGILLTIVILLLV